MALSIFLRVTRFIVLSTITSIIAVIIIVIFLFMMIIIIIIMLSLSSSSPSLSPLTSSPTSSSSLPFSSSSSPLRCRRYKLSCATCDRMCQRRDGILVSSISNMVISIFSSDNGDPSILTASSVTTSYPDKVRLEEKRGARKRRSDSGSCLLFWKSDISGLGLSGLGGAWYIK